MLYQFYLKRKNGDEQEQGDSFTDEKGKKRQKSLKLIPPDPRPLSLIIDELFEHHIIAEYSWEELNNVYKLLLTGLPNKGARWIEDNVRNGIADPSTLRPDEKIDLRNQAMFIKADEAGKKLKEELKRWEKEMNSVSNGMPTITTENTINLTGPPTDFKYINNYRPAEGIIIPENPILLCECVEDCKKSKSCCPKVVGEYNRGYYKNKRLDAKFVKRTIFECNKECPCGEGCPNRVVQDGLLPLKDMEFCIFQTPECGWGVKTLKEIDKGTFVCLYVGEIIYEKEAQRRGEKYDQEGSTYLFELDFNETDGEDSPYVVDGKYYGNISHFFNHSCDPNLGTYGVWSNCQDRDLPKLAFFALRTIPKDTELTFFYTRDKESTATVNAKRGEQQKPLPAINKLKCRCGSADCRKYLF